MYQPDFDNECYICGTTPCVIVTSHLHKPHTELCGAHFFKDPAMIYWQEWNEEPETQEPSEEDDE